MKVEFKNGLYMAVFKHRSGAVCMGYSPRLVEALLFCAELILTRDKEVSEYQKGHDDIRL
jgi:hypothetical protein